MNHLVETTHERRPQSHGLVQKCSIQSARDGLRHGWRVPRAGSDDAKLVNVTIPHRWSQGQHLGHQPDLLLLHQGPYMRQVVATPRFESLELFPERLTTVKIGVPPEIENGVDRADLPMPEAKQGSEPIAANGHCHLFCQTKIVGKSARHKAVDSEFVDHGGGVWFTG